MLAEWTLIGSDPEVGYQLLHEETILALLGVSAFLVSACGSADDTHDEAKAESVCVAGVKDKAGPIGDVAVAVADIVTAPGNVGSFFCQGKVDGFARFRSGSCLRGLRCESRREVACLQRSFVRLFDQFRR
ncbi:hypothetical protein RERY_07170 [Rhodococcus erythropolis]|nr:hypothetical protein RERY_07170 [Rhodococcus erythropolis]